MGIDARIDWVERACRREDKSAVKSQGATAELHLKVYFLSSGEVIGVACVAVQCEDIRKNTSGEGGSLDGN